MKEYNGHRSWNAWNVSLWINNDEGLYRHAAYLVKKGVRKQAARRLAEELKGQCTPGGARYNRLTIYLALDGMEGDIE